MVLTVNILDGGVALTTVNACQEHKGDVILAIHFTGGVIYTYTYISSEMECFSYKSEWVYRYA